MSRRPISALITAIAVGTASIALATSATAVGGGWPGHVTLAGAAEVPGPGDTDGTGTAHLRVNPGLGRVCYELTVASIAPATAAHVHRAPAGVAGPVVVPLAAPTAGTSSGCASVTRDLALEIIRNPDQFYVNVHNAEFPAGAVRGQLG